MKSTETLKKKLIVPLLNNTLSLLLLGLIIKSLTLPCFALDFEARQWSHLPIDINIFGAGYAYTKADIAFNPVLSIEDADLELKTWAGKYIRTFQFFDKEQIMEGLKVEIVRANGDVETISHTDPSDPDLRIMLDQMRPILAQAMGSLGQNFYFFPLPDLDEDGKRLMSPYEKGTLRVGLDERPDRGKWTTEVVGEVAFHTDNDDFFNGKTREQDPTYIIHAHLTHTFRPGVWLNTGIGYDYVGENSIDDVNSDDKQQDIGWLLKFAYPINRQSGFNFTYLGTRKQKSTGLDSDTLSASLSFSW